MVLELYYYYQKKEAWVMTDEQRQTIKSFREAGLGYKGIATRMGMSENTVKTFCRRNGLGGFRARGIVGEQHLCLCCGIVVECQSRLNFVHFSRRKNVQILLMFLCE